MDRHQVVGFPSRFGESSCEEIIERRQLFNSPVLPRSNLAQIATEFDEARVAFFLILLFPRQNFVNLRKDEDRSSVIQLGQHGRIPSKEARQANQGFLLQSVARDEFRRLWFAEAEPDVWATAAGVLQEVNLLGGKNGRFDLPNRVSPSWPNS